MKTPVEVLQKELSRLKVLASLQRHVHKSESKKLIPLFENAIKILNEVAVDGARKSYQSTHKNLCTHKIPCNECYMYR